MAEIKLKMGLLNDLSDADLDGGSVYFAKNKTIEKEEGENQIKYTYGELYYDEVIKDDQTEQDIITRVKISPSIERLEYEQKHSNESEIESLTSKIILEDNTIISSIIPFANINFPGIISTSEQNIQGNKNFFSNITVNQIDVENNALPIQKFKVDTDGNIDTFGNIIVKKTETENNQKITSEKFKVDTDGNIFANSLTITNQNDIGHIVFTRNNQNYIQLPEESSIGFLFGENKIADYCSLLISKNNFIINKVEKINDEITTSTTNFILDTDGNINTFGNIIVKKNEEKDNEIISVEKFKVDTDGNIFANSLTITNKDPIGHIIFTRSNQNYIQSPVNSAIGFLFNETKEADKCSLLINKDNLKPGTTNTIDLGSNSSRWKNIYTINLNACNGNIIVSKTRTTNNITFTDINLTIDKNGNIIPGVGNTNNLGSNSQSWKNVYTTNLNVVNYNSTDSDKQGYTTLIKEPSKDNYSLTLPSGNGKIPHMMSDNSDINPGGIIYGAVRRGEKGDIIEEAYACTSTGTASYLLKSNGENAPSWIQKVPIANGGTNAITAAGARQNINYIGANPITSTANDTQANWKALGSGIAYYSQDKCLNGQPTSHGFLINQVTNETACSHIWSADGEIYTRGYTTKNGFGSWKHLLSTKSTVTKNRMVWAKDTNELISGYHWVDEDKVGINLITEPNATLGVGGNIEAQDNINANTSQEATIGVYAKNPKGFIGISIEDNGDRGLKWYPNSENKEQWIIYYNATKGWVEQGSTYFTSVPRIMSSKYIPSIYFIPSSSDDNLPMGRISYQVQNNSTDENYTLSRIQFYQYSYDENTRTRRKDASGNGIHELFKFPVTEKNLAKTATYEILTTKNYPDDRYVNIDGDTMTGTLTINNTTASSSTSTGALIVKGGIGVAGASHFGTITINNTTKSKSTSTGALIVKGGIGVAGESYFGTIYAGSLRLYASTYYHTFTSNATSNKNITISNYSGNMMISRLEAYNTAADNPETEEIPFYRDATKGYVAFNNGIKYLHKEGVANTEGKSGYGILLLGNSVATTEAGNKYGAIRLYSASTGYMGIRARPTTTNITYYLPSARDTTKDHCLLSKQYIVGQSKITYGSETQRNNLTDLVTGQIFFQLV